MRRQGEITAAEALARLTAGQKKPTGATKDKILRGMFERFESTAAFIRKHGNDGAIILPLPPRLTNGSVPGLHWAAQKEIKEAYWSHCDGLFWARLVPRYETPPPELVRATVQMFVARQGDDDNSSARRKWPQDWLVKNRFMVDDAPQHFEVTELPSMVVPRKECRIEFRFLEN